MRDRKLTITMAGDGADDTLLLGALLDQLAVIRRTLTRLDTVITGSSPGLHYRVTAISMNSPATFVLEPERVEKKGRNHGNQVLSKLRRDLKSVSKGRRPARADLATLESYRALAKPMKSRQVMSVKLSFDNDETIEIPPNIDAKIDAILGPDNIELGSIVGQLEVVDFHRRPYQCTIFPQIGPTSIRGLYTEALKPKIGQALDKTVRLHGELRYKRSEKFAHEIEISDVEIIPKDEKKFLLSSLRGIAEGALGSQSSEQFVESIRDGDW